MTENLEARIRKIEDHQAILNLQAKYAFLVDDEKIEDLINLFAKDFIWEVGIKKMTTVNTRADLSDLLENSNETNAMTIHQPITPYIEINGDSAKGTWYLFGMLTSNTPQGKEPKWVQGRYNNTYIKEDGIWKFSKLSFRYNFLTPYDEGWVQTPFARFWTS